MWYPACREHVKTCDLPTLWILFTPLRACFRVKKYICMRGSNYFRKLRDDIPLLRGKTVLWLFGEADIPNLKTCFFFRITKSSFSIFLMSFLKKLFFLRSLPLSCALHIFSCSTTLFFWLETWHFFANLLYWNRCTGLNTLSWPSFIILLYSPACLPFNDIISF